MNNNQATVIVLLLVLLGLEAARSPAVAQLLHVGPSSATPASVNWSVVGLFFVASLIVIGVSSFAPEISITLLILLILGVLLMNANTYAGMLQSIMNQVPQAGTGGTNV